MAFKLIKMLLAPIIFGTVVLGMAKMGNITEVGRIGVRALIYFEVVSTIALVIGLIVVNVVQPGVGMNIDPGRIDAGAISGFTKTAESQGGTVQFFLDIIPNTIVDAFAKGAMLQVIFISVMMGICLVQIGERGKPVVDVINSLVQALFRFVSIVMRLAPIGAGAGVAYTIGRYGVGSLISLGWLMLSVYLTSLVFIVVILLVAQATNTPLTIGDQFVILGVLLLTSKGSAGVAGAGFVTLAATLASVGTIPVTGLVLLLGVDRFMNEARAVTNLIGNGIATIAIAKWDGALDQAMVREVINEQNGTAPPTVIDAEPEPEPLPHH